MLTLWKALSCEIVPGWFTRKQPPEDGSGQIEGCIIFLNSPLASLNQPFHLFITRSRFKFYNRYHHQSYRDRDSQNWLELASAVLADDLNDGSVWWLIDWRSPLIHWNISITGWISMKCSNIHWPQRMNSADFSSNAPMRVIFVIFLEMCQ